MTRRIVFAVACFALLTALAGPAWADAITFSYVGVLSTPPVALNDSSGVALGPAALTTITSSSSNTINPVSGTVLVSTGPASMYDDTTTPGIVVANFGPGAGTEVEVDSTSCVGGLHPGVCLLGSQNGMGASGFYVAFSGGTGAFQGSFHVDYVSPYVTSLFGDPNIWQQPGSDSFSTSSNNFVTKSFTDTATLGQGGITFQVTPEPGALAIFGTGVLVVAAVIRRKLR